MILEVTESRPERTSARLIWEGRARPDTLLYADFAPRRSGPTIRADADGWFLASALLADWLGEDRVVAKAAVCPELRENIRDSLALVNVWEGHGHRPSLSLSAPMPPAAVAAGNGLAALFFSSGADSLWTLFRNRETYLAGDFRRHAVGLMVGGFEVHDAAPMSIALEHGGRSAAALGLDFATIRTNIYSTFRAEDPHLEFLVARFEGGFFAALAHMLKPTIMRVDIATTLHLPHLQPNGSHPILRYSGENLAVRFDGLRQSRLEKIRDLANWPEALALLRVCNDVSSARAGHVNCGRCNKCLSTMLSLRAVGLSPPYSAFADAQLTPETVAAHFAPRFEVQRAHARELAEALDVAGDAGLASAVRARLASDSEGLV